MINNWLIRGDTHGDTNWITTQLKDYMPEETAVIVLGDLGWNFYLNKTDQKKKEYVENIGYYIYAIRGNHEMRPEHLDDINIIWDDNVGGYVYYEPLYPHIRYFKNYGIYHIGKYRCLIIGGAYSVDKWWRLERVGIHDPALNNPKQTGWFADECLTDDEMRECENIIEQTKDNNFDFVLTHTCPKKFQPVDLFLGGIDQSKVDESMEVWMDKIYSKIEVNIAWCFGHYHRDRVERPHIEQYFNDIETLNEIERRWMVYDETGEIDWYISKSPNFYNE